MKILVTGAAGYIGSNLCEFLLNKGYEVVGVDDFNGYYNPKVKEFNISEFKNNPSFSLYRVDITDVPLLSKVFKSENSISGIIHLAAWAGVTYSVENPSIYVDVNIGGTNNLAELAVKNRVENFIFASTSSVYGNNETPFVEDMDTSRPESPYPATKKACEVLLYTYHRNFNLKVTIFRFFNPLGCRIRPDMALPRLIKSAEYGYKFPVYQNPKSSSRDYTYMNHMLDALEYVVKQPFNYEIINLGNSEPVTLIDMLKTVEKVTGKKVTTVEKPLPGQMQITYANIDKARRLVGYSPKTPLEGMVEAYYSWFVKQPEWYKKFGI